MQQIHHPKPKWFDKECSVKKKDVKRCLRRFRSTHEDQDFDSYSKIRKDYKKLFEKKCDHRAADLSALLDAVDDSKEFWKQVRKLGHRKYVTNIIYTRQNGYNISKVSLTKMHLQLKTH